MILDTIEVKVPVVLIGFVLVMVLFLMGFWVGRMYERNVIEVLPESVIIAEPTIQYGNTEDATVSEKVLRRYGFTENDIYLMTLLLCGSAETDGDGEYDIDFMKEINQEQVNLVLCVVMNRVMDPRFPDRIDEVIFQPGQFVAVEKWDPNALPTVSEESFKIVKAWCEAYDNFDTSVQTIPESHLYFHGDGRINYSRE